MVRQFQVVEEGQVFLVEQIFLKVDRRLLVAVAVAAVLDRVGQGNQVAEEVLQVVQVRANN